MDFIYFFPTVIIVIAAFLVLHLRDENERKERQAMLAEFQAEREKLYNRIQAPEVEIQRTTAPNNPDYPPVALDDDREWERLTTERIDAG